MAKNPLYPSQPGRYTPEQRQLIHTYLRAALAEVEGDRLRLQSIHYTKRSAEDVAALVQLRTWRACLIWVMPGGRGNVCSEAPREPLYAFVLSPAESAIVVQYLTYRAGQVRRYIRALKAGLSELVTPDQAGQVITQTEYLRCLTHYIKHAQRDTNGQAG